jgi:hypothetical protein
MRVWVSDWKIAHHGRSGKAVVDYDGIHVIAPLHRREDDPDPDESGGFSGCTPARVGQG